MRTAKKKKRITCGTYYDLNILFRGTAIRPLAHKFSTRGHGRYDTPAIHTISGTIAGHFRSWHFSLLRAVLFSRPFDFLVFLETTDVSLPLDGAWTINRFLGLTITTPSRPRFPFSAPNPLSIPPPIDESL